VPPSSAPPGVPQRADGAVCGKGSGGGTANRTLPTGVPRPPLCPRDGPAFPYALDPPGLSPNGRGPLARDGFLGV